MVIFKIFLNSFIEVELIYNVLVTGIQQTDSIAHTHTHTHIHTRTYILFSVSFSLEVITKY